MIDVMQASQRGERDGVIGNRMKIIALLRDRSIWHPAWLGKLGVNMISGNFWA